NDSGNTNRIFCTTMGAATDLRNEGLRRLIVNAVYWGLEFDVPAKANVDLVGAYDPSPYGFNGFRRDMRPSDFGMNESAARRSNLLPLKLAPKERVALV